MKHTILVVNLGGTSTKVALYENDKSIAVETLRHPTEIIMQPFHEQIEFRFSSILKFLDKLGVNATEIDIVSARGGVLRPIQGALIILVRKWWMISRKADTVSTPLT
ncbi:hypothetical protein ACFOU0_14360 [Salinicoccus sesuvii]|uniref:Butyrate kinase n=1 Tax=Salinicoccus sesuvii TaxID=868281 RepID=A0ABV7N9B7_9STAP